MPDSVYPLDASLREARDWLRERVNDGARCPCCTQLAKVYRRAITAAGARMLGYLYLDAGRTFGSVPDIARRRMPERAHQGGYLTLTHYWGLIEEAPPSREDGGRVGFWRITDRGVAWLFAEITVPRYALLYDGRALGHDGPPVTFRKALGTSFDFGELMQHEPTS